MNFQKAFIELMVCHAFVDFYSMKIKIQFNFHGINKWEEKKTHIFFKTTPIKQNQLKI